MRKTAKAVSILALSAGLALMGAGAASAKASPAATRCAQSADSQHLTGDAKTRFVATCMKGPLGTSKPTAPTAANKESQAVTKPSGVDRATRTQQCTQEAERKHLAGTAKNQFQLSCLATAGPPSEGETGTNAPHPSNAIKGIGVNNYKPSSTTAKSSPSPQP